MLNINLESQTDPILYLDFLLIIGYANFIISNFRGKEYKYYISDKIFFIIYLDSFDNFHFSEKTFSNGFYMILYKFVDNTNDKDLNII